MYLYNNREFEPDYPDYIDETEFWEMAAGSEHRTSPVESMYLYDALGQLGKDTVNFFNKEYSTITLDCLLHFCVENEINLPKISGDFSGYPSVESVVLYEALRHLEPKTAKFFYEEYGGALTLEALCCFCATYGITISCVTAKEILNDKKSPENSPENSTGESIEKAPSEGLLDDANRSGSPRSL